MHHNLFLCGNYYGFLFLALQGMYISVLAVQNFKISLFHDLCYLFHRVKFLTHFWFIYTCCAIMLYKLYYINFLS
jgi:hypothetical protein